jgi:dihydroorotase
VSSLLIARGRVVDPSSGRDELADVRIRDGKIFEVGPRLSPQDGEEVFDASGAVVAPGLIDMHVHLREPGFTEKESIATGTRAALRGGFTSVACMPNTNPPLDDPAALHRLGEAVARSARVRVYPIAAMTRGRRGEEPGDYAALAHAGAVAFSDDGDTVPSAAVLRQAARVAAGVPGVFISHCEDAGIKAAEPMSSLAEDLIVARDLLVAGETGKGWHVAHVSTALALDLIRWARARGIRVTCEATPHHLTFTNALRESFGVAAAVNPPLRSEEDVAALRRAVLDGTVDALASDHAPHTDDDKRPARGAPAPGFTGLEIALGAYAAALPDLPLSRFVALLSTNPARILGIPGGSLAIGADADVTVFADRPWRVDCGAFASKGRCTPFDGLTLPRKAMATIVGGEIRYRDGGQAR